MIGFWVIETYTHPKTNMEPENHPFEKENHLPNLHFKLPSHFLGGAPHPISHPNGSNGLFHPAKKTTKQGRVKAI